MSGEWICGTVFCLSALLGPPNWTAPLEPSSVGRIALVVKTYDEMDPIQLAWMVNQMESYKPMPPLPRPSSPGNRRFVRRFPGEEGCFWGRSPSPPSDSPTAQGRWGPAVAPESGAVQLSRRVRHRARQVDIEQGYG